MYCNIRYMAANDAFLVVKANTKRAQTSQIKQQIKHIEKRLLKWFFISYKLLLKVLWQLKAWKISIPRTPKASVVAS